ncbi:MAG: arylsulfatase [Bacteroidota bacterium]
MRLSTFFLFFLTYFTTFAQQPKPNVILIYVDDMGWGELGSYGQDKIKTPNLDQLAKEGMRFTQFYSSSPVCAPSRSSLMTGKHAGHSFIKGNYEYGKFDDDSEEGGQMPLPEGTFTIGKLMQNAGYATGAIGKWGLGFNGTSGHPNKMGFDYFYGYLDQKHAHNFYTTHLWENDQKVLLQNPLIQVHTKIPENSPDSTFDQFIGKEYSVTKMADKAAAFITKHKQKPFFLYLPYTGPHVSLQAPKEAIAEYIGQFNDKPYYGQNGYVPSKYPRATYAAMISYLDKQVGKLMDQLKKEGLDKNTLVLFTSDNGTSAEGGVDPSYFNLTAGLRGLKRDLYEGGIRVPFIARWPGKIAPNKISSLNAVQFDLMATLAEITKTKAPKNDGISFLPELIGKSQQQAKHPYIYFEFAEKSGQVAVRMGNLKAIKSNMKKDKNAEWELFDLSIDREEKHNIIEKHLDLIPKFEAIVKKEHQIATIKEWEFINPKFFIQK